jgi:predicted nucleic acid-binding OB-fold protein
MELVGVEVQKEGRKQVKWGRKEYQIRHWPSVSVLREQIRKEQSGTVTNASTKPSTLQAETADELRALLNQIVREREEDFVSTFYYKFPSKDLVEKYM